MFLLKVSFTYFFYSNLYSINNHTTFFFFLFGSEEAVNICENLCVTMFRYFFAFDIMTLRQGSVHKILVRPFSPDPTTLPVSDRVRSLLKGLLMVKFFGASLRPHTLHTYFMDASQRKLQLQKTTFFELWWMTRFLTATLLLYCWFCLVFFSVECYWVDLNCFAFSHSLYTKFCFFSSENNADWCTFWTIIHSSILFSLTTYCMKFESFLFTLSFSKNMSGKKLF